MDDGSSWPEELDACHRLIEQLSSQLHQQAHELESREALAQEQSRTVVDLEASHQKLSQENEELKLTIRKLIERLYGRRSERFVADPNQISLDFGDDAAAAAEALAEAVLEAERTIEEVQAKRRAKRHKPRVRSEKFPEHLPRYEKIVDLPEEQKAGKAFIGYDEVETLEFERARLRVRVTKYAKYADPQQPKQGVESPQRPTGLVEGNRFDTSVAVEIIASRFFYHLPYYRQQDVFAGCGWTPSRSTLLNIVTASEFVLQPLVRYYHDLLGKIDVLGCDETPVTLIVPPQLPELDPQDPRSARLLEVLSKAQAEGRPSVQGRMWAYRSLEFPFNVFETARSPDQVVYELLVRLKAFTPLGQVREQLVLLTDDETKPRIPLYVSGRVIDKISIAPESVFFGKLAVGEQVTRKVVVRGSKPFRILAITSRSEGFHFKVNESKLKRHILEISFVAPQQIGQLKDAIHIVTDLDDNEATLTAHATVVTSAPAGSTFDQERPLP